MTGTSTTVSLHSTCGTSSTFWTLWIVGTLSLCHQSNVHDSIDVLDLWGFHRFLRSLDHGSLPWHRNGHIHDLVNALCLLHVHRFLGYCNERYLARPHGWHTHTLINSRSCSCAYAYHAAPLPCRNDMTWDDTLSVSRLEPSAVRVSQCEVINT